MGVQSFPLTTVREIILHSLQWKPLREDLPPLRITLDVRNSRLTDKADLPIHTSMSFDLGVRRTVEALTIIA